jgi:Mrp family chromosome partitioning ATPase
MIGSQPSALSDRFRVALATAMSEPVAIPGFVRQRHEILGRPPFDREFLGRCHDAFMGLLPRLAMPAGILAVVSPHRGDGRSSVAAGLALAICGDTGSRLAIIDLDFERPSLARLFGTQDSRGLADYLEREDRLRVLPGQPAGRLWLVPAGARRPESARLCHLVAGGRLPAIFREQVEWVVLDLPPLLDCPEAMLLADQADAYILVGRYQGTAVRALERAAALLPKDRPVGFVMTANASAVPAWLQRLI